VLSSREGSITFGFEWSDRDLTFDVVNTAVKSFIDARRELEVTSTSETLAILESHTATAEREIATLTQQLVDKQRHLRSTAPPPARRTVAPVGPDEETRKVDAMLAAKKRALGMLEEFRDRRLGELHSELAQLQNQYAPEHPIIAATRRNIDALTGRSPEIDSLRADVAGLERELARRGTKPGETRALLNDELAEARAHLEEDDARLDQERHALRLALRHYSDLLAEMADARVAQDIARAGFRYRYSVVMPPQLPKGPNKPKPSRFILGGLLGGVCFALFACTVLDLRRGVVLDRWQVEQGAGLPILAELPRPRRG
jgi:uncharacterized protein involved in exopolysaccharide biosynthesis